MFSYYYSYLHANSLIHRKRDETVAEEMLLIQILRYARQSRACIAELNAGVLLNCKIVLFALHKFGVDVSNVVQKPSRTV